MSKLTKQQARRHDRACRLLSNNTLRDDDVEFVLNHYQESETTTHVLNGAFFTPVNLALDLALHVAGRRVIDLCAGIGTLAWACQARNSHRWDRATPPFELVCVEKNPTYVDVGKKLLPQARWICADVFDLPQLLTELGEERFDVAIANPPHGHTGRRGRRGPRYRGRRTEYHVIDLAAGLANRGVFLIPQDSAPFRYSGEPCYRDALSGDYLEFARQTGLSLHAGIGVDTTYSEGDWHGVAPRTEIVLYDIDERALASLQPSGTSSAPARDSATPLPVPAAPGSLTLEPAQGTLF